MIYESATCKDCEKDVCLICDKGLVNRKNCHVYRNPYYVYKNFIYCLHYAIEEVERDQKEFDEFHFTMKKEMKEKELKYKGKFDRKVESFQYMFGTPDKKAKQTVDHASDKEEENNIEKNACDDLVDDDLV